VLYLCCFVSCDYLLSSSSSYNNNDNNNNNKYSLSHQHITDDRQCRECEMNVCYAIKCDVLMPSSLSSSMVVAKPTTTTTTTNNNNNNNKQQQTTTNNNNNNNHHHQSLLSKTTRTTTTIIIIIKYSLSHYILQMTGKCTECNMNVCDATKCGGMYLMASLGEHEKRLICKHCIQLVKKKKSKRRYYCCCLRCSCCNWYCCCYCN